MRRAIVCGVLAVLLAATAAGADPPAHDWCQMVEDAKSTLALDRWEDESRQLNAEWTSIYAEWTRYKADDNALTEQVELLEREPPGERTTRGWARLHEQSQAIGMRRETLARQVETWMQRRDVLDEELESQRRAFLSDYRQLQTHGSLDRCQPADLAH